MKSGYLLLASIFLLLSLLIGACTLPTLSAAGYTVNISGPGDGSVWTVGMDVGMQAELNYDGSLSPVTHLTFWANGRQVGDAPPTGERYTDIDWTPTAVGEYLLQVQATLSNGRIVISSPSSVCIVDIPLPDNLSNNSYGYTGPCPPPALPVISPSSAVFLMSAHATPDSLVYQSNPPVPGCVTTPRVTVQASLNDLADRAVFVFVDYDATGGSGTLVLTETASSLPTERFFSGSIDAVDTQLSGFAATHSSSTPTFTWTARAYDRSGAVLATDGPHEIPTGPCGPSIGMTPHIIEPLPTSTSTPASARDCPSGTFFAEQTHQCLPVQILPTKKASGCSRYDNASACTSNGCSWDKPSSTCH